MKRFLVVGETNVDVVLRGPAPQAGREVLADDCALALGGASAICASGLARLGNQVMFVSRVGTDLWGDYCLSRLRDAGVDTSYVVRERGVETGVTVSLSGRGDRALVTYLGSIDTVTAEDVPDRLFRDADHVHVSSFFLLSRLRPACAHLFERARMHGLTTSLDPGWDPCETWDGQLGAILDALDVFLPNEAELLAITGADSAAAALRRFERRARVAVKCGSAGAMALDGDSVLQVPAYAADVIDTTGAGDSFNAGFLHAFVRQQPIAECLAAGNACGALSTRALGGTTAQPAIDEMTALARAALERPARRSLGEGGR